MKPEDIIKKYNITLDTPSNVLTEFCKEFSPILVEHGYVPIDENLIVFRCYLSHVPGHKGRSIYCSDDCKYGEFDTILIFTELFYEFMNFCEKDEQHKVINSYIETLLHELAHQVCDSMRLNQGENGHGTEWQKVAKVLGCRFTDF